MTFVFRDGYTVTQVNLADRITATYKHITVANLYSYPRHYKCKLL